MSDSIDSQANLVGSFDEDGIPISKEQPLPIIKVDIPSVHYPDPRLLVAPMGETDVNCSNLSKVPPQLKRHVFKKGNQLSKARPPGLAQIMRSELEKCLTKRDRREIYLNIIDAAKVKPLTKLGLEAAEFIIERICGKPQQSIEISAGQPLYEQQRELRAILTAPDTQSGGKDTAPKNR